MSGFRKIQVAFYEMDFEETGVNFCAQRLAVWWTSVGDNRFAHTELVFPSQRNARNAPYSCSICENETVHYNAKGFGRDGVGFIDIRITAIKERALRIYCQKLARNKIPFNTLGHWVNFTPWPLKVDRCGKKLFCSELIVRALQHIGVIGSNVRACATSPNDLFKILQTIPSAALSYNRNKDRGELYGNIV